MTWQEWLILASSRLQQINKKNSGIEAKIILKTVINSSYVNLLAYSDTLLNDNQYKKLEILLNRREQGEPIAHLTGKKEFWSLNLKVSNNTMIPRPDTECLVEQALNIVSDASSNIKVLDLGTGSGAIALALASERSNWSIIGTDISIEAIFIAVYNANDLKLDNVKFICGDLFNPIKKNFYYDLIVSNPPYISVNDPYLSQGDVRFDPVHALVAEDNGLAYLKKICYTSPLYLKNNGWLILEHGWKQGNDVRSILKKAGFNKVRTVLDYGKNQRVSLGKLLFQHIKY